MICVLWTFLKCVVQLVLADERGLLFVSKLSN